MTVKKGLKAVVLVTVLLMLMGCTAIGPHTVARDRFDYTSAISDSWKAQMLVNMVKLRYGDTPTFLDVASVINQYSVESQMDFRLNWVDHVTSALASTQSAGGAARYIDRPGPPRRSGVLSADREDAQASGFGGHWIARPKNEREGGHPHDSSWQGG
jgi:hypothetical protein